MILPKKAYLNAGSGSGFYALYAFDRALQDAEIHNFNIVKVTSVLPPGAQIFKNKRPGSYELLPGAIAFSVLSKFTSSDVVSVNNIGIIAAAVSVALPVNRNEVGMFFEASGYGDQMHYQRIAVEMAEKAMSDRGLKIAKIDYISAEIELKEGEYAAVVASAILI